MKSNREKLKTIMQTPEYKMKQRLSKLGKKNGMYGRKGDLHPNWSRIECKCLYCGKIFYVKASHVAIGEGKYCSKDCYRKAISIKKTCLICGKEFWVGKSKAKTAKYCSWKCFLQNSPREKRNCLVCGKEFLVYQYQKKKNIGFYCNQKCYGKSLSINNTGKNHPLWLGGISFEPYGIEFNNCLKEKIRKRDNYQCRICGIKQNGRKLSVHHVDYDKTNNEDWNLITLCDSCHMKTNYNREYWQEHFSSSVNLNIVTQTI